jgi:hypothetical protein
MNACLISNYLKGFVNSDIFGRCYVELAYGRLGLKGMTSLSMA